MDILPGQRRIWDLFHKVAADTAKTFCYRQIDTPLFEHTALFERGVGAETDIVMKEMYTFEDHGGDSITLRPEGTAAVCRAYAEHGMKNLPQPVRLFYIGPMYRYERPQAGRFREFRQFGAEAVGDPSPAVDGEIIEMSWRFLSALGIKDTVLRINSIGDTQDRARYDKALRDYYGAYLTDLSEEERERLKRSPLRLLDAKEGVSKELAKDAPKSLDFLGEDAAQHFQRLLELLNGLQLTCEGFSYTISSTLVRGLDYYNRTVFEIAPNEEAGQQSTLLGGGRYDPLMEKIGGASVPAAGFAAGAERIVQTLAKCRPELSAEVGSCDAVVAFSSPNLNISAYKLSAELRAQGIAAICAPDRSLKAQMRYAGQMKAKHVLILGEREVSRGEVSVKDMGTGEQHEVLLDCLSSFMSRQVR